MINIIPSDITALHLFEGIFWLGWSFFVLLAVVMWMIAENK